MPGLELGTQVGITGASAAAGSVGTITFDELYPAVDAGTGRFSFSDTPDGANRFKKANGRITIDNTGTLLARKRLSSGRVESFAD